MRTLNASFAYLRMRKLKWEDVDYELTAAQAWTALESLHGLPLTPHDASAAWQEHAGEQVTLILVERLGPALIGRLHDLAAHRAPAFVYAWLPGR